MTAREKKLATFLLVLLLGAGGFLVGKKLYFDPSRKLAQQIREKEDQIDARIAEIKKEKEYMGAIARLSPRLGQWWKYSLPEGTGTSDAAMKAHLTTIKTEYHKYLSDLLTECKVKVKSISTGKEEQKTAQGTTAAQRKPLFYSVAYDIRGDAKLANVMQVFESLYKQPLLHQIRKFTIARLANEKDPDLLSVDLTVEVAMVFGAEKIDAPTRAGLFPKIDDKSKAMVLASVGRSYKDIASKNVFIPAPEKVESDRPVEPPKSPGEDEDKVLPYVRLTMISYSEYYGSWIAQIHNLATRDNFTTILVDKELPKGTRYQKEKEDALKKNETPPAEPVMRWAVKDRFKNTLRDIQIVRIDPLRIIFQCEGELYLYDIGTPLSYTLEEPLDKAEIKTLGLVGDRDTTLKRVALKELLFKKDRKGYEGHFINPDNRDEKMVLATEMLPEEFDAPETWVVKDKFGSEMLKMKVVKVEKDRLVFTADKKYYGIKPGESVLDAMAKPLTEAEVKALDLKAP
jgi:hypothetical protein